MYSRLFWASQRPVLEIPTQKCIMQEGAGIPSRAEENRSNATRLLFSKVCSSGLGRGAILPRAKGPFRLAVPWRTFRGLGRT